MADFELSRSTHVDADPEGLAALKATAEAR